MADIRQNPEWAGNRLAELAAPSLGIDPTHQIAASAAPLLGIDANPMISQAPQKGKPRPYGATQQGVGHPEENAASRMAGAVLEGSRANEPLGMSYGGDAEKELQRSLGYGTPQYYAAETAIRPIATIGDLVTRLFGGALAGVGQGAEETQRAVAGPGEAIPGVLGTPEQANREVQNLLGMKVMEGPGARAKAPGVDYAVPHEDKIIPPETKTAAERAAPDLQIEGELSPSRPQNAQAVQREAQRVKQEMQPAPVGGQAQPVQPWQGESKPPKNYSLDAPPPKTAQLPAVTQLKRPESDWHARVADLDANNAPDGQYRAILSTGSKGTRASGAPKDASSWRDKVVGYLNTAAGKNAPVDPVHELAAKAATDLAVPPPEAPMPRRQEGQGIAAVKIGDQVWTGPSHADAMEKAGQHFDAIKQPFPEASLDQNSFGVVDANGKFAPSSTDMLLPKKAAPFTAAPPPPEAAAAAAQGMPPPGAPPPPTVGAPPPGAPPPLDPRAPAPFLEGAANVDPGPMNPKRVTEMENDLFAIKSADRGRKEIVQTQQLPRIKQALVRSFGTDAAKVDRQLYHDVENGRPIEPRAQAYYDQTIKPRRDANLAKWQELRSYNMPDLTDIVENPNQMHRMRIGKTRGMDEASGLGETVGYRGGNLSTRPSGARKRTILAMEDAAGNHKVVTEHPGSNAVFVWENGKRRTEAGGLIRTKEERTIPGAEIPGRETLAKPVVAKVEGGGLTQAHYTEPKQIPDRVTQDRTIEPSLVNDRFRKGSEFVDMNNKRWFIRDATTEEIHNAGVRDVKRVRVGPGQYRISYGEPVRFHESALASTIMNGLELDKALATAKFRAKWQASPEFKERSVANADATPEQRREWVPIQAPGWEGRYYEPRFAEPIIDHLTGQGYHIPIVDAASNFATGWLFKTGIGSIAHGVNEHLQRLVARGVEGNVNVVARAKTALQTFDETMNKGPIWQDYRNKGASFPSDSQHWRSVEGNILHTLGMQLAKEPGFKNWAKRHGLYSDEAGNIVEHAIGKAVFEYGDFIALQHGLELERRGFTREQAIERMNKVLPTYRIPSRIVTKGKGGRAMAQAAASPSTFQFGRFTYARFKGLSNIVEDLAGKGKSFRDRKDALSRLITVAVIMGFVAPFIDKQLQKASGNNNTHFLWGGSLGMVARAVRMADDVRAGRKNAVEGVLDSLTSSVNLGPMLKELIQQYTGRDLYNDRQFVAPTDPTMQDIAERATHIGSTFFAPAQALSDPGRYLMEPMRLSTSKPFDPNAHSRGGAKRQVLQERGRLNRLPAPVRGILKYGGVNR